MATSTDRIEKTIVLRAPRARVWRALADSAEFGEWFGMKLDGPFEPGARRLGTITSPGYTHLTAELVIEKVEPPRHLSFRWHPHAIEPGVDYAAEPMTLVAFDLEEVSEGTRLTLVESGFDSIPLARRAKAFAANDEGWSIQVTRIEKHVADAG